MNNAERRILLPPQDAEMIRAQLRIDGLDMNQGTPLERGMVEFVTQVERPGGLRKPSVGTNLGRRTRK